MTEDKRSEIVKLAKVAHQFSERFAVLSLFNKATDAVERENQAVEYALARAEMIEANEALRAAIGA